MHPLTAFIPFTLLLTTHIVAQRLPSPKPNTPTPAVVDAAAIAKCQDIKTFTTKFGPDPTCWETLDMDTQLQNWSLSRPGCAWDEGWAECFYRTGSNASIPLNCTERVPAVYCPMPFPDTRAEIGYGGLSIIAFAGYTQAVQEYLRKTEVERKTSYSAPDVVGFLMGSPWGNDTKLKAVDKSMAVLMENRTDTNGVAALNQTSEDMLAYFGSGNLLKLASGGGLLGIDVALVR
ncbi:MAG: hypothetical protein Q9221_006737 [Calogaya cf. arnoldii]